MNILNLIIKQNFFDQIIAGTKTKENREIRPKNANKYCVFDTKTGVFVEPKKYDAIQFNVGYQTNRQTALVAVTGAELIQIVDENDKEIIFVYEGEEYVMCNMQYSLGAVLKKNF